MSATTFSRSAIGNIGVQIRTAPQRRIAVMEQLGRMLLITGGVLALLGLLMMLGPKLPFRLGRLPLDFHYQRDNFSFYFPLGTSILLSVLLSLVFAVLNRR